MMNYRRVLAAAAFIASILAVAAVDLDKNLLRRVKGSRQGASGSNLREEQQRKLPGTPGGKKGKGGGQRPPKRKPKRILVTLSAVQPVAIETILVANAADGANSLGTQYIYNSDLYSDTSLAQTSVVGFVTGTCTRTQALVQDTNAAVVGGGHCGFTYTVDDGTLGGTIEAAGELYDVFNNTLSVTGGTQSFEGAYGSILLIPVYPDNGSTDVDVFTDADYYLMDAAISIPYQPGWGQGY